MTKQRRIYFFRTTVLFLLALGFLRTSAWSEETSLEKALKSFNAADVQGYVQPLADIFGANMGAGWYRTAEIPQMGFSFSFDIIAMGSVIGAEQETYTANSPPGYSQPTFQTATVFGKKGGTVTDPSGLSYKGSDGSVSASLFPLAALQVNIGTLYGTQLMIRGLPIPAISGAPSISYWGGGVRHSISQYFGNEPEVNVALSAYYSRISFGDIISVNNFGVGPQISKKFSIIELYGGIAYEKSSMNIKFTSTTSGNAVVDITLDGVNKFRGTLGAVLNLGPVHLHGDANFGSITNFSAGIGFGF